MITKLKQELENFTGLNLFRCPKCGKIFEWDNKVIKFATLKDLPAFGLGKMKNFRKF